MISYSFLLGIVLISHATLRTHCSSSRTVPQNTFKGDATYTTPGLGACERVSHEPQLVAALNRQQFGNPKRSRDSPWCGQCVQISAPDFSTSVTVEIVDRAEGSEGHIVLSEAAFSRLASTDEGRINVEWHATTCHRNQTGRSSRASGFSDTRGPMTIFRGDDSDQDSSQDTHIQSGNQVLSRNRGIGSSRPVDQGNVRDAISPAGQLAGTSDSGINVEMGKKNSRVASVNSWRSAGTDVGIPSGDGSESGLSVAIKP